MGRGQSVIVIVDVVFHLLVEFGAGLCSIQVQVVLLDGSPETLKHQWFGSPKGTDFSQLKPQKLFFIQEKLNHRPRKKLGYLTPYEVFYGNLALNS